MQSVDQPRQNHNGMLDGLRTAVVAVLMCAEGRMILVLLREYLKYSGERTVLLGAGTIWHAPAAKTNVSLPQIHY